MDRNTYIRALEILTNPTTDFRKICVALGNQDPELLVELVDGVKYPDTVQQCPAKEIANELRNNRVVKAITLIRKYYDLNIKNARDVAIYCMYRYAPGMVHQNWNDPILSDRLFKIAKGIINYLIPPQED